MRTQNRSRSIAAMWMMFETQVMPLNAPPIQRKEMRRAFYAGAHAMLEECVLAAGLPQDDAVAVLRSLNNESAAFGAKVAAGGA